MLRDRRFLDAAIEGHDAIRALAPRDRGFARHLAATSLRRLGQIDDLLAHCLDRPLPAAAEEVRAVLRLGVAQLVFLGVPAHAGVGETVALARARGHDRHAGLVNAVLRRLAREGKALAAAQDAPRLDTPDWLWRSWSEAYGAGQARAIVAAHLKEPPLDLTLKDGPAGWAARLDAAVLPTGTLRRTAGGAVEQLAGFAEGAWWVQDAAAALPVRLLGEVAGRRVIDLCAAPGGKTAQLAAAGARVLAVDRDPARLARVAANLDRLGLAAELIEADATTWRPAERAEAVLLDAPCTGTGACRRHPDIPRLKGPADVTRMAAIQDRLLAAASAMVRPGGVVVFCTCSLERAEGPGRVAALAGAGLGLVPEPIRAAEIGTLAELIDGDGALRTLPCHLAEAGGMDGFYAARMRRA